MTTIPALIRDLHTPEEATMTTIRFEEIKRSKTVKFKCPCGRRFQRTVAVWQTVNPWNSHPDGRAKTRNEITDEVNAAIRDKQPDATCSCGQTAAVVEPRPAVAK